MPTYLDRYLAGEHEQVWDELLALGATVREQPLYDDALAVARETMQRARYNVETIVARLMENGYEFDEYQDQIFVEPSSKEQSYIQMLEDNRLSLPLSLLSWHQVIGSVDLTGYHKAWSRQGGRLLLDPLMVLPLYMTIEDYTAIHRGRETMLRTAMGLRGPVNVMLSHDEVDKAGMDSSDGFYITIPNSAADGTLYYKNGNAIATFVSYLRRSFQWGGFPGFANVDESLRPTAMLAQLTEGLLPI